jgi:hypothetical protein
MEPLFYVMAIMGCADSGDMCSEARIARPQFTSYQACQLAMDDQLMLNSDLSFPVIQAQCRGTRPIMASKDVPSRS